ncbi:MAG: hypothetical protein R3E08_07735 [Thiotrichaceae bacterium]
MLRIIRLFTVILISWNLLIPQALAATQTVCATPNLTIPDNNIVGVSHTLTISDTSTINSLHLKNLAINHQHIGELTLTLKHGDRVVKLLDKPVMLANQYGCTGKNFSGLMLSDAASQTVEDASTSTDPLWR